VDKHMYAAMALWMQLKATIAEHLEDRSRGQGFVEYGFIILFVGVALTAALVTLRGGISGLFQDVTDCLSGGGSAAC
jgi:Flp pilus assembly pilin Flp